MNLFYRFIRRFQIIWRWIPVIWNDFDWDYGFILEVMRHKIIRTRKEMENAQFHVGWEETVNNMRIAEQLLNRFTNRDFNRPKSPLCICEENQWEKWANDTKKYKPICDHCFYSYKNEEEIWKFMFNHLRDEMRDWWD